MSLPNIKAIDLMEEPLVIAFPETKVGEIVSKMKEYNQRVAPVINNAGYLLGVVSLRRIMESGVGNQSRVTRVMEPPYYLLINADFTTIIARFVLWKAKAIPVVNESRFLKGILRRENVLKYLHEARLLPREPVEKYMSTPAIVIKESESIARARWLMIRNGISRLPVVENDNNRLTGVISMIDIAEKLYRIRLTRRRGFEQFEEEFLAAPVKDFMSVPPIDITRNASLDDAVKLLLEYNISGLPVTENQLVVGVISGIDIMRAYAKQLEVRMPIEAKIPDDVSDLSKIAIERLITNHIARIGRSINIIDFKASIKSERKTKEKKEGRARYRVKIKLVTDIGMYTAEGIGWDPASATRDALMALEKRIRKELGRTLELHRISKAKAMEEQS